MTIKKITAEEAKNTKGKTDWKEVDDLTDEEIKNAVKDDPDAIIPTDDELKEFSPVKSSDKEK